MQIINSQQNNVVEKVLRDKDGRLVRARFAVYLQAGRVKARLLSFTYIQTIKAAVHAVVGTIKKEIEKILNFFDIDFPTPKLAFQKIHVNGSKPRAPTQ